VKGDDIMLISTFKRFKIMTFISGDGKYITVKKGENYEVILNVYKTEEQATKGHRKLADRYNNSNATKWDRSIAGILKAKGEAVR
jgi:hypothetical protein